jgi:hypothetical protein
MTMITYDTAAPARAAVAAARPAIKRNGWLARAFARLVEARQRQANREIARYGIVLSNDPDRARR